MMTLLIVLATAAEAYLRLRTLPAERHRSTGATSAICSSAVPAAR